MYIMPNNFNIIFVTSTLIVRINWKL